MAWALILALVLLAAALAAAVVQATSAPEWGVAALGAGLLVVTGAISSAGARHALSDLGPTVGFLAALLVLAEGCRREGLFDALGARMAHGARGRPRRLLALVFGVASAVTAVLSLDATVVLLTPIVFATAARMRTSPRPHVFACAHLANSASLLLPVSNLTNLLAFRASGLSFARFAELMALPWLVAIGVEWLVLSRFFAVDLRRPRAADVGSAPVDPLPRFPLAVVGLALAGFAASSAIGIAPVWVATAGAVAITAPALVRNTTALSALVGAAEPGFLVFVLGLGVIVRSAGENGLDSAVRWLLPAGGSLPTLLAIAALSAVLANLVNNLPATLIVVPVVAASGGGAGAVLAVLVGVNAGPNLTYVGSLATLLWRRVLHAGDVELDLAEFTRLGALTVPAVLLGATFALWLAVEAFL